MKRCPQCWQEKPASAFQRSRGTSTALTRQCDVCRLRYASWGDKSVAEKLAEQPARVDPAPTGRVRWMPRSHNVKLGGLPASMSERGTCPPSCGLYQAGCYAGYGKLGHHWRETGDEGIPWGAFLERVAALPEGQLWRHNVAGDLPGIGEAVDPDMLGGLVEANRGRRGFTFTHKTSTDNFEVLQWSNLEGFTINLSADTIEEADSFFQEQYVEGVPHLTKAGPVVVVLPHDAPRTLRTPAGHLVTVCPAEVDPEVTCADCGACANARRSSIIGFRAHGQFKRHVPELVQLRRSTAAVQPGAAT